MILGITKSLHMSLSVVAIVAVRCRPMVYGVVATADLGSCRMVLWMWRASGEDGQVMAGRALSRKSNGRVWDGICLCPLPVLEDCSHQLVAGYEDDVFPPRSRGRSEVRSQVSRHESVMCDWTAMGVTAFEGCEAARLMLSWAPVFMM